MNEPVLPGMPEPPPSTPAAPAGVRVTRSDGRRLCERCCEQIHALGIIHAPYPSTARWRVTTATAVSLLCHAHKTEEFG